jgi:hypothetical protein
MGTIGAAPDIHIENFITVRILSTNAPDLKGKSDVHVQYFRNGDFKGETQRFGLPGFSVADEKV